MEKSNLISVQQFCTHYKVSKAFINELQEYELIDVLVSENENYLYKNQLYAVEKIIRLHYDLKINLEGIDVIHNLLKQIEKLQIEKTELKNKLRFYED
ncbi:MerR family transcriptional regulator [Polaribacter reichenbachii]|uniref:MerR family transcriptional regulator n=1 Tax=Polaribacter reichenbachii TaxID=996801 RepID=A0A1B8TVL1_9FLAO|nr:chaperone modulator CbpM [Polaribacter reichenbachii]APZ45466.1 MerR family transcriptional regulator [Polaribacter reichenbachii]AUC19327.1 MerR family transcriptional regulator [Polaribacter reichenbachii]OBY63519.1 MerR family transcriptional regulator [Polaribacter reichenbachii]